MGNLNYLDTNNAVNAGEILNPLSRAEKNFLHFLKKAVGQQTVIVPKVAIIDVLSKHDNAEDYENKVFDFVIYDKTHSFIVCIIELDDRSHALQQSQPEASYQSLCDEAGIPLMEIPARCGYDVDSLSAEIINYLDSKR